MTTIPEIVRAAIPDASEADIEHVMWARTPFPCGSVSARMIYKAASQLARAGKNKIRLCDCCANRAEPDEWLCKRCDAVLHSHSARAA